MSIEFKNVAVSDMGTSYALVYTCPSNVNSVIVFGFSLANSTAGTVTVDVSIVDDSESITSYIVSPGTSIAAGSSLVVAGGVQKLVLNHDDRIYVKSSVASSVDAFLSILENS